MRKNTRKRSEPIASPQLPVSEPRLSRRRLIGFGALGIGATTLVSCAQGTRREAERGREKDAERTSIVDNLQATQMAELVNGTPPSTPTVEAGE